MKKTAPHPLSSAAWRGKHVGILGGSFNPAHAGHLHISLLALRDMKLDEIWWLVSPQNPLKSGRDMAHFNERLESAVALCQGQPRIVVSDLETRLGTRFTADTLRALRLRFPHTRFVWMMGADNLLQIGKWQRWREIFSKTDVAVYRRPPYSVGVTKGVAATRFCRQRLGTKKAGQLTQRESPHWVLFSNRLNPLSATEIRAQRKRSPPW